MTKETRLDDLLDIISHNPTLSSEQVMSQLNSRPDEIETRGEESELRVKEVIESLEFVKESVDITRGEIKLRDGEHLAFGSMCR